jgi:hypothetical protein
VTYPLYSIDSSILRILRIIFRDRDHNSRAKPRGVHGAKIIWTVSEHPVTNIDAMTHSAFDTRSPFTIEFQDGQRGQTVWFCLCWENSKGERGPWSEIVSAVIP